MKHGRTEEWAKWRRLVSEQIASGQTVAAFCRDRGLRVWQFYDWKKQLLPKHPMAEAIKYALGHWEELNVFVAQGDV
jgi:hypothetical protein